MRLPFIGLNRLDLSLLEGQLARLWQSSRVAEMHSYIQHGDTSCLVHCIAVAYYSLALARLLRLPICARSLVVGALLHDYFLYDWHDPDPSHRLHGFFHAGKALHNARRDCVLDDIESNIIERHMFPLNLKPPTYMESILVCGVDKICSLLETLRRRPYGEGPGQLISHCLSR